MRVCGGETRNNTKGREKHSLFLLLAGTLDAETRLLGDLVVHLRQGWDGVRNVSNVQSLKVKPGVEEGQVTAQTNLGLAGLLGVLLGLLVALGLGSLGLGLGLRLGLESLAELACPISRQEIIIHVCTNLIGT